MGPYPIHRDFKRYAYIKPPLPTVLLPLINAVLGRATEWAKTSGDIRVSKQIIPGLKEGKIKLSIYEPMNIRNHAPCLLYLHGGAFILKATPFHKRLACVYALNTPCKVVFVDYRLAPQNAFPVGVEDCYAAFEWVNHNAEALGIDSTRIAIGGDSAGGALAAAVSLMARDRKAPNPCFQMLIYPVTDARQISQSIKSFWDTPLWNSRLNKKMWKLYLKNGIPCKKEYASPLEAVSLENLPDAYIEIADFDCLRDEGIQYAEALNKTGISVELNKTIGTIHGFDLMKNSDIVKESMDRRIAALRKALILSKNE